MRVRLFLAILSLCVAGTAPALAQTARADLRSADGEAVGGATLTQTPRGVLIKLDARKLPPGDHAFHIHEVGKCEPPFESAGGHFNPTSKKHGMMVPDGEHAGDMPNIVVPASGESQVEILNDAVTLAKGRRNSLLDADGSALVIHAMPDDYKTDPAGNAGGRIACGVVK